MLQHRFRSKGKDCSLPLTFSPQVNPSKQAHFLRANDTTTGGSIHRKTTWESIKLPLSPCFQLYLNSASQFGDLELLLQFAVTTARAVFKGAHKQKQHIHWLNCMSSQSELVLFHKKRRLSQTMCPYLPSKSALAPKQQLYNNINFIHTSMITLRAVISVIQKHQMGTSVSKQLNEETIEFLWRTQKVHR